jgi:hypothetical protein
MNAATLPPAEPASRIRDPDPAGTFLLESESRKERPMSARAPSPGDTDPSTARGTRLTDEQT